MADSLLLQLTRCAYEEPGFSWCALSPQAQEQYLDDTRRMLTQLARLADGMGDKQAALFVQKILDEHPATVADDHSD